MHAIQPKPRHALRRRDRLVLWLERIGFLAPWDREAGAYSVLDRRDGR